MDIVGLLAAFADPARMQQLTLNDKLLAGLVTTVLGMGVTFVALIILQVVIVLLGRLPRAAPAVSSASAQDAPPAVQGMSANGISKETVAAITTALAVLLKTSPEKLVVKEIRRLEDTTPAWGKAGIAEQLRGRPDC